MGEEPYGQGALLDGLVPRLVGLERVRERRHRPGFGGAGPLVRITGGRASGKTALLDALAEGYAHRVPLARADLAAPDLGHNALDGMLPTESPTASPVTHLLHLLRYQLGLRTRGGGLPFPRLSLGLLVATAWLPDPDGRGLVPAQLLDAQRRLWHWLTSPRSDPRQRRRHIEEWLAALTDSLPVVLPGLETLVGALVATGREFLLSQRSRGPLRWWGRRLSAALGDDIDRLFSFIVDFQTMGESRRTAERRLVEAFVADVAARYGFLQRQNARPLPLVLLDNAHAGVGPRFLDLLGDGYAALAADAGAPVHPVVVATALGHERCEHPGAEHHAGCPRPFDDVGRPFAWSAAEAGGWLLRVRINEVRPEHIRTMLRVALGPVRYPPDLERPIARLSGGRAGCARLLVDAAVRRLGSVADPARLTGDDLLADGVGHDLLELLLPGQLPVRRGDTVLLSAALEPAAARGLLREHGAPPPQDDGDAARRLNHVRDELAGRHWNHDPWPAPAAPPVRDRALRALLLRRLADRPRPARAGAPVDWETAHGWLRDHASGGAGRNDDPVRRAFALHHALALGELEAVTSRLHELFVALTPARWLAVVTIVCAAPRPPREPVRPAGTASTPTVPAPWPTDCPVCSGDHPAHRSIRQLTRCVWRLSDPTATTPDPEDVDEVHSVLDWLHRYHDADAGVFGNAAHAWRTQLREGIQAPALWTPPPETSEGTLS